MTLHTTTDVDEIAALLENVLAVDALRNTVFGSVLRGLDAASQIATSVGVTADRDILTDWFGAFRAESLGGVPAGFNAAAEVAQRWRTVRMWL